MKRLTLLLVLMLSLSAMSQNDTIHYYWVQLTDKTGTPYTIDNPEQYLSQRALERRQRLGIKVDSIDLPVNPAYLKAVSNTGATIHNVSKWLNGLTVKADEAQIKKVEGLSFVSFTAHYNKRAAMVDTTRNNYSAGAEHPTQQYNKYDETYYNLAYSQIKQLNAVELHRRGFEGQGVLVGVCDGGFPGVDTLVLFDSLRTSGRLVATRDFVAHRPSVFLANDHGTMVLSNMAGYLPGKYVGTAPKASYILCITEDSHTESLIEELNWVSAAEYMDSMGVDVINSSLGYRGFDDKSTSHSFEQLDGFQPWMSRGAEIATTRGIICVNSAGNEGREGAGSISAPADAPSVLSVGAVKRDSTLASFSSYGALVDGRVKPDVCAQGVSVCVASPLGGYLYANGTSFSSPITAGIVACLRQAAPKASVADIHRALRLSADHADRVDNRYGYGIPDCVKALRSLQMINMHGRVHEMGTRPAHPKKLKTDGSHRTLKRNK